MGTTLKDQAMIEALQQKGIELSSLPSTETLKIKAFSEKDKKEQKEYKRKQKTNKKKYPVAKSPFNLQLNEIKEVKNGKITKYHEEQERKLDAMLYKHLLETSFNVKGVNELNSQENLEQLNKLILNRILEEEKIEEYKKSINTPNNQLSETKKRKMESFLKEHENDEKIAEIKKKASQTFLKKHGNSEDFKSIMLGLDLAYLDLIELIEVQKLYESVGKGAPHEDREAFFHLLKKYNNENKNSSDTIQNKIGNIFGMMYLEKNTMDEKARIENSKQKKESPKPAVQKQTQTAPRAFLIGFHRKRTESKLEPKSSPKGKSKIDIGSHKKNKP